jgi:hypothetical protein
LSKTVEEGRKRGRLTCKIGSLKRKRDPIKSAKPMRNFFMSQLVYRKGLKDKNNRMAG